MRKVLPLIMGILSIGLPGFTQISPVPYVGCPNGNFAVARAGNNSGIFNPMSIYTIATATGTPSLLSGPIKDPANPLLNLQVNGVGVNSVDGYLYGLNAGLPSVDLSLPFRPSIPFYRIGINGVAEQVGIIKAPKAPVAAPSNASIINSAAGEFDQLGNYYFTAVSAKVHPNHNDPLGVEFEITNLLLGKLSGTAILLPGTGELEPTYVEITNPSNDAALYLATITGTQTLLAVQNSGIRDLIYNKFDGQLYTYVTFPDLSNPTGSFYGQMLKLNPTTGVLSAVAAPVILSFANASNEVAGTLFDKEGNFLILFTNGNIYKATTVGIGMYSGAITLLNGATGFPAVLRGDLASCGAGPDGGPLPVILSNFNAYRQNNGIVINWRTASEVNVNRFIVETSSDAVNWTHFSELLPQGMGEYNIQDNSSIGKIIYYRLAIIDNNGSIKYSGIKKILLDNYIFDINAYPNPATTSIMIESQQAFTAKADIRILDAMGKRYTVTSKKVAENMINVNLSRLNKGVYYIQIANANGVFATKRFTKL
ncbi:MAG: T9SS type A sorting domain-containing protein [Bacteroidota bacterium]